MNKLELKEYNDVYVRYLYTPEGKGEPGEIVYYFSDGAAKLEKRAEEDTAIGRYGYKATRKIEECVKENNLPIKFTQAWY